jgi:hypothetical protein
MWMSQFRQALQLRQQLQTLGTFQGGDLEGVAAVATVGAWGKQQTWEFSPTKWEVEARKVRTSGA